jgi:CheY-like chemotaxis protein
MSQQKKSWLRALFGGREMPPDKVPAGAKRTILVIDDDPSFLNGIKEMLLAAEFAVLAADSGVKGLNLVRYSAHKINAVVVDYRMPRLDGLDTVRYLRELSPQTKVIAVSGVPPADIPAPFRGNVDHFLEKPFHRQQLLDALTAALAG